MYLKTRPYPILYRVNKNYILLILDDNFLNAYTGEQLSIHVSDAARDSRKSRSTCVLIVCPALSSPLRGRDFALRILNVTKKKKINKNSHHTT